VPTTKELATTEQSSANRAERTATHDSAGVDYGRGGADGYGVG
jgi:hypothetical protein